ncbi:hypothetical protein Avbf_12644 [Armadillidium vulgare]|nr:hypothetical protein Avbf_12644 [Armadillidium vulgare]
MKFSVIEIKRGKKKRLAFLDLLLEYSDEYEALSDEDIREEDKVYEEIESIFGNSEREASSSDLREMKYLDCCIKESLRLFPSVPGYGRELNEDAIIDAFQIYGSKRNKHHDIRVSVTQRPRSIPRSRNLQTRTILSRKLRQPKSFCIYSI